MVSTHPHLSTRMAPSLPDSPTFSSYYLISQNIWLIYVEENGQEAGENMICDFK